MAEADLHGLFGSDDESDGEAERQAPPTAPPQAVTDQVAAAHAAAGLEDSEEDEPPNVVAVEPRGPRSDANTAYVRDEEEAPEEGEGVGPDGEERGEGARGVAARPVGPPMEYAANLAPLPDPSTLRSMKLSNIFGIETRPFDEDYYQVEHEMFKDENGVPRVRLRNANVIRWRMGDEADTKESNARFVRWEDGSMTLHIGSEVLECQDQDISAQHNYLYVRHQGLIQGQAPLEKKLIIRPTSVKGGVHRALMAKVEAQRNARFQGKVQETVTTREPEQDSKMRERQEEARIRELTRLRAKQTKRMASAYAPGLGGAGTSADGGRLAASYLEEDDYDDDDGLTASQRARNALATRPAIDEDEEFENEQRLAAAKRASLEESGMATKRRRMDDSEDDSLGDEPPRPAAGTKVKGRMVLSDDDDSD